MATVNEVDKVMAFLTNLKGVHGSVNGTGTLEKLIMSFLIIQ